MVDGGASEDIKEKIEKARVNERASCQLAFLKVRIKELERANEDLEKKASQNKTRSGGVSSTFAKENLQLRKKIAQLERRLFNN